MTSYITIIIKKTNDVTGNRQELKILLPNKNYIISRKYVLSVFNTFELFSNDPTTN